ncbi:hypothetical protein ABT160_26780 [Streptomyces sp. NPDC001941]|uniref:hypothetical protein n=1 Tax=Streptomyces sp. NPDC001941 TaxID=3154659 RepID=UPI003332A0C4
MSFEEQLGDALRRSGEEFAPGDRRALVEGGLVRGRRREARRRAGAVSGSVLALALIGGGAAFAGGLVGGEQPLAASPAASGQAAVASKDLRAGDIAQVMKRHTPKGKWTFSGLNEKAQSALGVYDDGKGKAAVSVGLYRASDTGEGGLDQVTCPSWDDVPYDDCRSRALPDGSRLMVFKGYVYPDKREETKDWRAVLLTRDGLLVDVNEYNAPAEKGEPVSRLNPPFTDVQLEALARTPDWRPLLKKLPTVTDGSAAAQDKSAATAGKGVQDVLRSLLPTALKVNKAGGEGEYGYLVVNDGKGGSLVEVNVQPDMRGAEGDLFPPGTYTKLSDGTKVRVLKRPGEKGGKGVVWWTVDTMRPNGFRVVLSAFNAVKQDGTATRSEPALSIEQMRGIATSPDWRKVK